jgi:hypothetical protein
MKMNTGQAEAQFHSLGMKMENIEIIINKLKMEVDSTFWVMQAVPSF